PSSAAWARPRLTTMPTSRTPRPYHSAARTSQRARRELCYDALVRRSRDDQPTLFATRDADIPAADAPLAERRRPRPLDEFVGPGHLLGPQRLLREMIEGQRLHSLILWGPPGSGKTSLARLIARNAQARFIAFSAVLSGVKDLRLVVDEARVERRR